MLHMTGTILAILMFAMLHSCANAYANANSYLLTNSRSQDPESEADLQTSLLTEVESTFGEGSVSIRVKQIKDGLASIYLALPKNEKGYLGPATVRYALHRLFVQRHGWIIRGLDAAGGHRNSTSSAGLLKDQVPTHIQDIFEQLLDSRGLGLTELAILAAAIEHLIHNEATKRVDLAFKAHGLLPTSLLNEGIADEILDTYMAFYITGEDLSGMTFAEARHLTAQMPDVYGHWNASKDFTRNVRRDVIRSVGSAEQKASGEVDFSLIARVAERVSEKFGGFQHQECEVMKTSLVKMEEQGSGRVRLSDFYKPALDGEFQFAETVPYLRQLGALDETDPDKPRVIIANYMSSPTNSIASSSFYSVGCMNECEGLLGQLEQQFEAPDATPDRIFRRVAMLGSSSVAVPRSLSSALLKRLNEIAAEHGGRVPLHGRLFAQWMHHAYPLECPYPHVSGTTNPQTEDEWSSSTGEEVVASHDEMSAHVEKAANEAENKVDTTELPWAPEEELLVVRAPIVKKSGGESRLLTNMRNVVVFAALLSSAYGLVCLSGGQKVAGFVGSQKILV